MNPVKATTVLRQMRKVVELCIGKGLSVVEQSPICKSRGNGLIEISHKSAQGASSIALRNVPYEQIYKALRKEKAFLICMCDGALVQMMYRFKNENQIIGHRLAFFPLLQSNDQDDTDHEHEKENTVRFPIRFDFDHADNRYQPIVHPKTHLSLGQYKHCRIPVSGPLTPYQFATFILRNFYHKDGVIWEEELGNFKGVFGETIENEDKAVIHLQLPGI